MRAKICICCIVLIISQLVRCMEKQEIEIVIQPDTTPQTQPPASTDLAKKAVLVALGGNNDWLEQMLAKRIDGENATAKIIPIHRIHEPSERKLLRAYLKKETEKAQQDSVELLKAHDPETAQFLSKPEDNQAVSKWVINALLDEKLKDRTVRDNSDYWKYINGFLLAVLAPTATLLTYFLSRHSCPDAGSN